MGSSVDSYLHKKFKKQLSIEPKPQNHDKENKANSRVVESSEEKMTFENGHATARDNNESVPNKSTNQNSSYFTVNSSYNSKSSISNDKCITNLQSNPCISEDISSSKALDGFRRVSFDNQFNSVPSTVRSSINDNLNSKSKYVNKPDDISVDLQSKEEVAVNKPPEEVQPPPDRNSSGKYVCNYCNLVCSKPSVLQKHIRAHTNERPYPCVSCGFSFKTRSNLYKHCRSRTHANRVMGNKAQEITEAESTKVQGISKNHEEPALNHQDSRSKPYKPRFHTAKLFDVSKENIEDDKQDSVVYHNPDAKDFITHHINELINKNTSIVSSNDVNLLKKRLVIESSNNNDYSGDSSQIPDEPLNLSNKNRKRSMSEVVAEPQVQKSLIKELLLKNVYSNINMQCQYCKMIFQTVTELELHEFRSCKGKPSGAKYTRSSSVNVASILTQNKNAFDNIPYLQNTAFPLNSPGPFLGKTRLVESDKSKSFSFDDGLRSNLTLSNDLMSSFSMSPFEKKMPVKLFGGEVKIAQSTGETKKFKIDSKTQEKFETSKSFDDYSDKLSENRVIKFSLQSGGTVLTNKSKVESRPQDVMRSYEMMSPSVDRGNLMPHFNFERHNDVVNDHREDLRPVNDDSSTISLSPNVKTPNIYPNIMDFSQKAVKMLTPNLKQPNIIVTASPTKFMCEDTKPVIYEMDWDPDTRKPVIEKTPSVIRKVVPVPRPSPNLPSSPVNLLVDGKLVRHVPGMPGPVVAEEPIDMAYNGTKILVTSPRPPKQSPLSMPTVRLSPEPMDTSEPPSPQPQRFSKPHKTETLEIKTDFLPKGGERRSPSIKITEFRSPIKSSELKSPLGIIITESKKFARPNSLALKPTTASLKQHHGLTPTMFNQILISPDTPRVNKKYVHHFLHGNYFSYLDLKSSTKPVYCTLNKTQPFYVPHFKKLSMYSEWRQQDTKTDKLFVSAYDSRQKPQRYTQAGRNQELLYIDSSYKFMVSELPSNNVEMSNNVEKEEQSKPNPILGGYESNEDYTYIRGRGRGRYVCEQCGIRCKKPSMLKKHIRTHSIDRPYTCNHCNFSFKTKGNLTKHMKSKVHTKNYSASSSSSSSTQQSGTQSSESDTDDSGMDSSDESTRQQEHEAAYGLLSLSQKTTQNITPQPDALVNSNSLSNHCYSPVSSMSVTENVMSTDEINYLSKFNIAKNKTLEERSPLIIKVPNVNHEVSQHSEESFSDPPPPQHNNHDKNSMAKSVASEYLKIATQFDVNQDGVIDATTIGPISKDMNDLIVKPEGNKTCGICHKSFSKPSQLRLHMNIHYLERPFRCDSCSVSFRSKGHLLKHERSASHHNKLSATSVQASAEPRPFKCSDCNIAFRIHGHLAKHLRSKMHIMKLECLAKIPFGLYAELERSNSLLTEINTCDGDQCLESLKTLAKKVFSNDPSKLNQMEATDVMDADN